MCKRCAGNQESGSGGGVGGKGGAGNQEVEELQELQEVGVFRRCAGVHEIQVCRCARVA